MLALGFRCYEDGEDQLFDYLADLIDVPTTALDLTETTRTVNGEEDRQEEAGRYAESACAGL